MAKTSAERQREYRARKKADLQADRELFGYAEVKPKRNKAEKQKAYRERQKAKGIKPPKRKKKKSPKKKTPKLLDIIFIDGEGVKLEETGVFDGKEYSKSEYVYLSAVRSLRDVDGTTPKQLTILLEKHMDEMRINQLYRPSGIMLDDVITFLKKLSWTKAKTPEHKIALAGYYLNYDVEHWLRGLSDREYLFVITGEDRLSEEEKLETETVYGTEYLVYRRHPNHEKILIHYLRNKFFKLGFPTKDDDTKYWFITVYDSSGYFQMSFQQALRSWGFEVPEEVRAGKESRGEFITADYESGYVQKYSLYEGECGAALLNYFVVLANNAFQEAKVLGKVRERDLYGPGSLARQWLKGYKYLADVPLYTISTEEGRKHVGGLTIAGWPMPNPDNPIVQQLGHFEDFSRWENFLVGHTELEGAGWKSQLLPLEDDATYKDALRFPFLWAYFGGRIEESEAGWVGSAIDYDMNGAYPTAITRIPKLLTLPEFVTTKKGLAIVLKNRFLGIFRIRWNMPEGWDWYPFPFRDKRKSISFPQKGRGWVTGYELYAVVDTLSEWKNHITIEEFFGYTDTAGLGDGVNALPEDRKTRMGKAIEQAMIVRLKMKKEGNPGNKPLKLAPNSVYGKTIQQIGTTLGKVLEGKSLFQPFVAMACTGFTRAMIWRAISGNVTGRQVVSIQTDGVLSRVELPVKIGSGLGEWELATFHNTVQVQPGIYRWEDVDGNANNKVRGITKEDDIMDVYEALKIDGVYHAQGTRFITRFMSLIQKEVLKGHAYQWLPQSKEITIKLATKRMGKWGERLPATGTAYFPPKQASWIGESLPYEPKFERHYDMEYLTAMEIEVCETGGLTAKEGRGGE